MCCRFRLLSWEWDCGIGTDKPRFSSEGRRTDQPARAPVPIGPPLPRSAIDMYSIECLSKTRSSQFHLPLARWRDRYMNLSAVGWSGPPFTRRASQLRHRCLCERDGKPGKMGTADHKANTANVFLLLVWICIRVLLIYVETNSMCHKNDNFAGALYL